MFFVFLCVLCWGNTWAEAFIDWVRGTECMRCGDTAFALFLTTDPLNVREEHTTFIKHMGWAASNGEEAIHPRETLRLLNGGPGTGRESEGLAAHELGLDAPSNKHQAGRLHFESMGVGLDGLPAAAGVDFPQCLTGGGLFCRGGGLLRGLSLPWWKCRPMAGVLGKRAGGAWRGAAFLGRHNLKASSSFFLSSHLCCINATAGPKRARPGSTDAPAMRRFSLSGRPDRVKGRSH